MNNDKKNLIGTEEFSLKMGLYLKATSYYDKSLVKFSEDEKAGHNSPRMGIYKIKNIVAIDSGGCVYNQPFKFIASANFKGRREDDFIEWISVDVRVNPLLNKIAEHNLHMFNIKAEKTLETLTQIVSLGEIHVKALVLQDGKYGVKWELVPFK